MALRASAISGLSVLTVTGIALQTHDIPLQSELPEGVVQLAEASNCRCLRWKDAYEKYNVTCGQGHEIPGGMTNKEEFGNQFCTAFYERLNRRFCTQMHYRTESTDQWCYVSSTCNKLNGGEWVPHSTANWKKCSAQKDEMLATKMPESLAQYSEEANVDKALISRLSYPVYEGGLQWKDIKPLYNSQLFSHGPQLGDQADVIREKLDEVMATKMPMVIDSSDGRAPFAVVVGMRVYYYTSNEGNKTRQDPLTHASQITTIRCLKGCEQGA